MKNKSHFLEILITQEGTLLCKSQFGEVSHSLDLSTFDFSLFVDYGMPDFDPKVAGRYLFERIFPDRVGTYYVTSREAARTKKAYLHLSLNILHPELATLPFELLYDPSQRQFLCCCTDLVLSRYLSVEQRIPEEPVLDALNILIIVSVPSELELLNFSAELHSINKGVARIRKKYAVRCRTLKNPTIKEVNKEIRKREYHVVHFIGHGTFHNGKGHLSFVSEDGSIEYVDEERFSNVFISRGRILLIVLNSCEGASSSSYDVVSGVARYLVLRGIPNIIAMNLNIPDEIALSFSEEFYACWSETLSVGISLQETRKSILVRSGANNCYFAYPVFFCRSRTPGVFRFATTALKKHMPKKSKPVKEIRLLPVRFIPFDIGNFLDREKLYSYCAKSGLKPRQLQKLRKVPNYLLSFDKNNVIFHLFSEGICVAEIQENAKSYELTYKSLVQILFDRRRTHLDFLKGRCGLHCLISGVRIEFNTSFAEPDPRFSYFENWAYNGFLYVMSIHHIIAKDIDRNSTLFQDFLLGIVEPGLTGIHNSPTTDIPYDACLENVDQIAERLESERKKNRLPFWRIDLDYDASFYASWADVVIVLTEYRKDVSNLISSLEIEVQRCWFLSYILREARDRGFSDISKALAPIQKSCYKKLLHVDPVEDSLYHELRNALVTTSKLNEVLGKVYDNDEQV